MVKNRSVLCVAKEQMLFPLNTRTDRIETGDVFSQYIKCTRALAAVNNELDCVCLRWITTDEKAQRVVAGKDLKLNIKTKLNVSKWPELMPFRKVLGVIDAVRGNYGIPPPSACYL